ncbi:aminotransferase class V-fold PLP-dependent enzyme [candidate division WOR-3 bacterium]|uniref:Probable glycine dehydrogenase (decarboxylating) subunit 2 n=1 Tax=candidate division WOR-3 bacterium TaxID=2052148 RepID=A0A9D5K8V7_UNCW3|nr:aminotransferase class V-fold PLP-dependent enzyme [candidate division WOR-3 bacterium]MBD3363775.1 aminotransferase class V-fold PLP-dependent enzyme [candidate division WOR-3 bacterium]
MKMLFDLSKTGRSAFKFAKLDVPKKGLSDYIPERYLRKNQALLPEVAEPELARHFTHLASMNHHIDKGFYPLGSCTMKYNPKVNEHTSRLPGFSGLHPLAPVKITQGALRLMYELQGLLAEISGFDAVTLEPAAGAQGELCANLITRAYFKERGEERTKVIIPDSAHGTNPASVTLSGFESVTVASNADGLIDLDDLTEKLSTDIALIMITNPNTLGLFERDICKITEKVHRAGALAYLDGANLNALMGIVKPADMGFDLMHFNLHKTFSTPHGGGGPGSGPVGVTKELADFLPVPVITKDADEYSLIYNRPKTIGKLHGYYGNFGVMVKAYTYIRLLGASGLYEVSKNAILNANYLKTLIGKYLEIPHSRHCMHEFVASGKELKMFNNLRTADLAKRLLDYGYHSPTVYFPLIVSEALMVEPTETETAETLDGFATAVQRIVQEARINPEMLRKAPHTTPVGRLDEVRAIKELDVCYRPDRRT